MRRRLLSAPGLRSAARPALLPSPDSAANSRGMLPVSVSPHSTCTVNALFPAEEPFEQQYAGYAHSAWDADYRRQCQTEPDFISCSRVP